MLKNVANSPPRVNEIKHVEARRLHELGYKLCELHPMQKRPVGDDWQRNPVDQIIDEAGGYGMPLALNGLCSADPDNVELARVGMQRCGFDLEALMNAGVRTSSTRPSSGGRSTFKVPAGVSLRRVVFSSKVHGTILELRAGQSNLQDSLPGTRYHGKDGDGPYEQAYAGSRTIDQASEPPADFLAWWRRMDEDVLFKREQQQLFAGPSAVLAVSAGTGKGAKLAFASSHRADYNAANVMTDILARHGYTTEDGERWAPSTATGAPCVRLIPGHDDLWQSDHASDPLCGTFDPWSAHVVLDHGGDLQAAEHAIVSNDFRDIEADAMAAQATAREKLEDLIAGGELVYESVEDFLEDVKELAPLTAYAVQGCEALVERLKGPVLALAPDLADADATIRQAIGKPARPRFSSVSVGELLARPALRWFIKNVLPQADLGVIYGASGAGKSFMVNDMALSIARGVPWRGHRVRQARITYVCAEGQAGLAKRLQAYSIRHGVDIAALPFRPITDVPNLLADDDQLMAKQINAEGGTDIIIIDTLAQTTPGADENGSEDMGKALAHCRRLASATGALVLLVHHAGKDLARGARGWSGMKAAADVELSVERDVAGGVRCLTVTKSKDGEDGGKFPFRLAVVPVGADEDGDVLTSCVVDHTDEQITKDVLVGAGKWQVAVFNAAVALNGVEAPTGAQVLERALETVPVTESDTPRRRRERVKDALKTLVGNNVLKTSDGRVHVL